jgi:hypothetical protein
LSLTFVEKLAPTPVHPMVVYVSWGAFGLAVLCVVVSFVFSQQAIENEMRYIAQVRDAVERRAATRPPRPTNRATAVTKWLNLGSGGFFVVGLALLIIFGALNWPPSKDTGNAAAVPANVKLKISGEIVAETPTVRTTTGAAREGQQPAPSATTPAATKR